jgi:hypothetical protein
MANEKNPPNPELKYPLKIQPLSEQRATVAGTAQKV